MAIPEALVAQRDAGMRAFSRRDFIAAHTLLTPCAEAGDTGSQLLLARMYYAGNGVTADPDRYRYWLEQAASNGDRSARARLKRLQAQSGDAGTIR